MHGHLTFLARHCVPANMTQDDLYEEHRAALNRLHELIEQRGKLVASFRGLQLDSAEAQSIWGKVWEVTAAITASIEEVNGYTERTGKPIFE